MTAGQLFRRLTRVIRRLEDSGWSVEAIQPANDTALFVEESITVEILCQFTNEHPPAPPGTRSLDLEGQPIHITPSRLDTSPAGVSASIRVEVYPPDTEASTHVAQDTTHPPLHQDRDRLTRLYHECRTFGEMVDAIDEDVSAETIRRYMIEHEIHTPGKSTRSQIESHPIHPILADGMGPPQDIQWEELIEVVAESSTVYDVQRRLDLGRDRTTTMLQQLGLMDLVLGRLDDAASQTEREAEIRRRLTHLAK